MENVGSDMPLILTIISYNLSTIIVTQMPSYLYYTCDHNYLILLQTIHKYTLLLTLTFILSFIYSYMLHYSLYIITNSLNFILYPFIMYSLFYILNTNFK